MKNNMKSSQKIKVPYDSAMPILSVFVLLIFAKYIHFGQVSKNDSHFKHNKISTVIKLKLIVKSIELVILCMHLNFLCIIFFYILVLHMWTLVWGLFQLCFFMRALSACWASQSFVAYHSHHRKFNLSGPLGIKCQ